MKGVELSVPTDGNNTLWLSKKTSMKEFIFY